MQQAVNRYPVEEAEPGNKLAAPQLLEDVSISLEEGKALLRKQEAERVVAARTEGTPIPHNYD